MIVNDTIEITMNITKHEDKNRTNKANDLSLTPYS